MTGFLDLTAEQRFWVKVEKTDTCWLWTASLRRGYGKFTVHHGLQVPAHRFAYELLVGPIPKGLTLDHLCRVRHCVNPAHLEPVTVRTNTLRGTGPASLNAAKTSCIHGHEYTPENTMWDRKRGWRGCRACKIVARRDYRRRKRQAA